MFVPISLNQLQLDVDALRGSEGPAVFPVRGFRFLMGAEDAHHLFHLTRRHFLSTVARNRLASLMRLAAGNPDCAHNVISTTGAKVPRSQLLRDGGVQ
jgi:hypothetical protein